MGLREEKKQRTRLRILATAEAMFRKRGFEATLMREIAARLRISPQTLYNYFPAKESLLTAIFAQRLRDMAVAAERLRVEVLESDIASGDSVDRFLDIVRQGLRALDDDRGFMRMVYLNAMAVRGAVAAGTARGDADFEAAQAANDRVLERIFGGMQHAGRLRADVAPREIAELYVLLFSDRVTRWLASGDGDVEDLENRVIGSLGILFRGLGASPGGAG
jgi:AcrR family transcriptional regulator